MKTLKGFFRKFGDSSRELGSVKVLALCAMMLALRIVLGIYANYTLSFIPLPVIKVSLTFIPVMLTAYLFGPVCAGIVAGFGDVFSYLLAPTALGFNPGITACYIIEGIIYGVCLYQTQLMPKDVIIAKVADLLLCTVTLNAIVLKLLFFPDTPLYTIILYRAMVLIPMAILEVVMILLLKRPLLIAQKQLHTK